MITRRPGPARHAVDVPPEEPPHEASSRSPAFRDVVAERASRRAVLRGGLAAAIAGILAPSVSRRIGGGARADSPVSQSLLGFEAVPVGEGDTVAVPDGYSFQVLLPWGEPITGAHPPFRLDNTGAEQAMQMGTHHDGVHFFPIEGRHPDRGSSDDGLLVMNHEYIEPRLMHRAAVGRPLRALEVPLDENGSRDPEQVLKEINAHGVSVCRIRKGSDGRWAPVTDDARNRRITGLTRMLFSGPARGHDSLKTRYSPEGTATRGTLNNCAIGVTPWNTYLTCEENWWFYFGRPGDDAPASLRRYGVGRLNPWLWQRAAGGADEYVRFDPARRGATPADDYRNEPHCFGWVVEIDPFDPESTPVKRTHLGRFSHEGAVVAPAAEGEPVVVYSGDDAQGGYIFKFVSTRPYHAATADGSLLDEGTLYAARFDADGTGEWLALVPGRNGLTEENGFPDLAAVLINARGAGDVAGATPMDRPEWAAVDPVSGTVYFTLSNGSRRTEPDAANPRANNVYGHIIRWDEREPTGTRFEWELFALGGDQEHGRDLHGAPLTDDNTFGSPDGLWIDPDRRLWIQTDIAEFDLHVGPYAAIGNNMMLAADPETGEIRRFLTGPVGQEITGVVTTPDQRTMFVNVQHPGGGSTSAEAFARGELASHWPDGGTAYPRSATLVITKDDGGKIGT